MLVFLLIIMHYALLSLATMSTKVKQEQTIRVVILSSVVVLVVLIWAPDKKPTDPWLIYALAHVLVPIGFASILKLWAADASSSNSTRQSVKPANRPKNRPNPAPKPSQATPPPTKTFQPIAPQKPKDRSKATNSQVMLLTHSQIKRVDKKLEKFEKILEDLENHTKGLQNNQLQLSKKSLKYVQQGIKNTPVKINMLYEYIYQAMLNAQRNQLLPRLQKSTYIAELTMYLYKVKELREAFETLANNLLHSNQHILSKEDMAVFTKLAIEPIALADSSLNPPKTRSLPNVEIDQQAAKLWQKYHSSDEESFWQEYSQWVEVAQQQADANST